MTSLHAAIGNDNTCLKITEIKTNRTYV